MEQKKKLVHQPASRYEEVVRYSTMKCRDFLRAKFDLACLSGVQCWLFCLRASTGELRLPVIVGRCTVQGPTL